MRRPIVLVLFFLWAGPAIQALFAGAPPSASENALEHRAERVARIVQVSAAAIANPAFLQTGEWHDFISWLQDDSVLQLDDTAFREAFNQASQALPFSHFRLFWRRPEGASEQGRPPVEVTALADDTALLRVRGFDFEPAVMTHVRARIFNGKYQKLVVDLRGNEGGSFPSVVALSSILSGEAIDAGVFLTRKWFIQHGDYPDDSQRAEIAALQTLDLEAFAARLQSDGAVRLVLPPHEEPVFEGRVVILTDRETASAAEPFVYLMQRRGAIVIGERTAGAMLSADRIPIDDTFTLFVPVADYMTADGVRLDQRGVMPDVAVAADAALDAATNLLSVR